MKKILCLIILAVSSIRILSAQSSPAWIEESYREKVYPSSEYYTGFSQERARNSYSLSSEIDILKQDARNKLSESIVVRHSGQTSFDNRSYMYTSDQGASETISTHYSQKIKAITETVLAHVEEKTYYNPQESMIYAFVCVSKKDLEAFYQRNIRLLMDKTSSVAEIALSFSSAGDKKQAREKLTEAKTLAESMEPYFRMLASVNPSCPDLDYYTDANQLYGRICSSLSEAEKGPSVYMEVTYTPGKSPEEPFHSDPQILAPLIRQALGEAGAVICEDSEKADYILSIETSSSVRSLPKEGSFGVISYYANASGKIVNRHTGKETGSFYLFKDADCYASGATIEKAATRAFLLPALKDKIINKIINSIPL